MSEEKMKKIGLVGCGTIGTGIARAVDAGKINAVFAGLCDADASLSEKLSASLSAKPQVMDLETLVAASDIVVECAHVSAVAKTADLCLAHGRDLMVMSVGGLNADIFERFEKSSANLYAPSGAVAGIDGILASAMGEIESMSLTTSKPPAGLKGAPYLVENNIDLDAVKSATVVFDGSPKDAIKGFPKNVNVSTTLGFASSAGDKFRVRIVADPASSGNIHEVELRGSLGNIRVRVENKPSADNPKTSALAYYSAIAALKKILSHVKIGT